MIYVRLHSKSIDELREIAVLRGFKKLDDLTKEDLIFRLLKSESNPIERSYFKYFNNSISDDTYDHEIKSKINDIRLILSRLGNIVTKNDRKKIKKDLYEIEKRQNLSDNEKEKIYDDLIRLANTLDKKEEHKHSDHDDLNYFGIRELVNLFTNDDCNDDSYYEPVLFRNSFKNNYDYYQIRGDKNKELSIKQYLYVVMPDLADLINKKKNDRVECKIQFNMGVNFISTNDSGEIRTFYVRSDNDEIRSGNETFKCFQYSITAALNHQNIENHPERISNIKPFIDKYNWKGIDFPAGIKDCKKV